jgi:aminopeptidase N
MHKKHLSSIGGFAKKKKEPMLLPLAVGLLDSKGHDMSLSSVKEGASLHNFSNPDGSSVTTAVLRVDKAEQEFTFLDVKEKPVASLLRNFSAPVRLEEDQQKSAN